MVNTTSAAAATCEGPSHAVAPSFTSGAALLPMKCAVGIEAQHKIVGLAPTRKPETGDAHDASGIPAFEPKNFDVMATAATVKSQPECRHPHLGVLLNTNTLKPAFIICWHMAEPITPVPIHLADMKR